MSNDGGYGSDLDDFVAHDDEAESEEDAFEPVRSSTLIRKSYGRGLGPPITTDERMRDLPEIHRALVHQFVGAAKKVEEKLRNKNGHSKCYFTESDFREMAINWTLTLEHMHTISTIDHDKVDKYGQKFLALIEDYHDSYNQMMEPNDARVMDENHRIVIHISSDEEAEDDDDVSTAEQQSKFFQQSANVSEFNKRMLEAQKLPPVNHPQSDMPKPSYREGGFKSKGKFRGGRRGSTRKSNGSASGSGTGGSRGGRSNSGVTKAPSRRASGGSKRGGSSKDMNLMKQFGNSSGRGAGGIGMGMGGGGIGMMPT